MEWAKYDEDTDPIWLRINIKHIETLQPFQLHQLVHVATRTKSGKSTGGDGVVTKVNNGTVSYWSLSLACTDWALSSLSYFKKQTEQYIQCGFRTIWRKLASYVYSWWWFIRGTKGSKTSKNDLLFHSTAAFHPRNGIKDKSERQSPTAFNSSFTWKKNGKRRLFCEQQLIGIMDSVRQNLFGSRP